MVLAQGALGYGLTSVMGAVVVEIFQGKHYGSIFGTIMLAALAGGAAGPWVTGVLHDFTGNYTVGLRDRHRRQRAVGDRDLAGVAAQDSRGRGPVAQVAGRRIARPFSARSRRRNAHRLLQIADRAQETVGRRGLRIDQAVQAKAVLQRQHDRAGPCRVQRSVLAGVLRRRSRRYRRSAFGARAAAWRVRAGAFRRAPQTGSSPCAKAESGRADPARLRSMVFSASMKSARLLCWARRSRLRRMDCST